ncbi:MAG: class I adenylate-forming enzyme family protein [Mesorhizobium sp.]
MAAFNVSDMFIAAAMRNRSRDAIVTAQVTLGYADLLDRASQCARHLSRRGVEPGDRLAIALPKPDHVVIVILAAWMLGATPMVIDFRAKRSEKAYLADHFDLAAVVESTASPTEANYRSITVADGFYDDIAAESGELFLPRPGDHPALIVRTSGTTGTPQGIVYSHNTLTNIHWGMGVALTGFDRGPLVHALPLFYASPLIRTLSQILDGATTHILPLMASAEELAETFLSTTAQISSVVPPQLHALLRLSEGRTTPMFPQMRNLIATGSRVDGEASIRAVRELCSGFAVTYGSTVGGSISLLVGDAIQTKAGTVGRPMPFNHLRIEGNDGQALGPGEIGLIKIRSPLIADDILGEAREDSDRLVDGWAIPGDLGFIDEDGFLTLTGRASDMIIRNGVNVFPREIEGILERHPSVVEAAVLGYSSVATGEEIAAFVVVADDVALADIIDHARASIVPDKRPRHIQIIDRLPRNDAGKVVKRLLAEQLAASQP